MPRSLLTAHQVVDAGKAKVDPDPVDRLPGEVEAGHHVQEVVADQDDVGRLHGDVGAAADGDAFGDWKERGLILINIIINIDIN